MAKRNDAWQRHSHPIFPSTQVVSISGTAPRWLWATSTLILKEERSDQTASSPRGDPRCHFLGLAWSAPCQARLSSRWTALREFSCPLSQKCASSVNQRWNRRHPGALRTTAPSSQPAPVLCCQLLTNVYPVCMEAQVFAQDRVQLGPFPSETLSPLPYRPLRAIQSGRLHLPEGLLWADRARSAAALFPAKQPVTSEFVNPSVGGATIWCQVTLSVIPAEFSAKQLAGVWSSGLLKMNVSTQNALSMSERITNAFLLHSSFFAMFQSMNMTSFEKIGARAMKNELKMVSIFFSGHPVQSDTVTDYTQNSNLTTAAGHSHRLQNSNLLQSVIVQTCYRTRQLQTYTDTAVYRPCESAYRRRAGRCWSASSGSRRFRWSRPDRRSGRWSGHTAGAGPDTAGQSGTTRCSDSLQHPATILWGRQLRPTLKNSAKRGARTVRTSAVTRLVNDSDLIRESNQNQMIFVWIRKRMKSHVFITAWITRWTDSFFLNLIESWVESNQFQRDVESNQFTKLESCDRRPSCTLLHLFALFIDQSAKLFQPLCI